MYAKYKKWEKDRNYTHTHTNAYEDKVTTERQVTIEK